MQLTQTSQNVCTHSFSFDLSRLQRHQYRCYRRELKTKRVQTNTIEREINEEGKQKSQDMTEESLKS